MPKAAEWFLPYASHIQTLTFLFTDIEGSTALLRRLGDDAYARVLADHHRIIRSGLQAHDGIEHGTQGDSFFASFGSASACVLAAIEIQRALSGHEWPPGEDVRVRMGLHTGEASEASTGLVGFGVHRAARIAAVSHGGQVLVSATTAEIVRDSLPAGSTLRDLGVHRLKDLGRQEELYQLVIDGLQFDFPQLRSLSNPELLHNLPVQLSSFIGRESELCEIRDLVAAYRLVTLTGPGGCGKTRLALQVGADLLDGSGSGVWFVDFAPLRDERFVGETLAAVLGVRQEPGLDIVDSLTASISDRSMLVVLDNCEHLVDPCAKLTDRLLRACSGLTILATSREPLGVDGEHPYRVPSLGLPGEDAMPDAATIADCEAVQLLVERARVHDPAFAVDDANAAAVAAICERLDGIPLALELVAARMSVMTPEDVERRLDDRFRLLTGSSRTALPRQQTLLASLDWSYDLLDPAQRSVLQRLSMFVGSFDLAAAETVCAGGDVEAYEVAEHARRLVDRSLVRAEQDGLTRRLRLGETVREYAGRKLLDVGVDELESARESHAAHYDAVARNLPPMGSLRPMSVDDALAEERGFALELGNARAALEHSLTDTEDVDRSLRLAELYSWCGGEASRGEFIQVLEPHAARLARGDPWWRALVEFDLGTSLAARGRMDDGMAYLETAKSAAVASGNIYAALRANGNLLFFACRQGQDARARALADEGVALAEASGDVDLVAFAECDRGRFFLQSDDQIGIDDLCNAAAHFLRRGLERQYWECIESLALAELMAGDLASAKEHFEAALGSGAGKDYWDDTAHLNVAALCVMQDDIDVAIEHWLDGASSIERNRLASYYWAVLVVGALCCSAAGQFVVAAGLHGAATQTIEELGDEFEPFEANLRVLDLVKLRSTIGEESFEREFAAGRAMTFEAATALGRDALDGNQRPT